jgi:hypothetical protein
MDNFQKNSQRNRSHKETSSLDDEVKKLIRKGNEKVTSSDFTKLREKYDEAHVDEIQKSYLEKHHLISKRGKKLAKFIKRKYGDQQYPFHVLLEYAKKVKTHYGLSDDEFVEFQRIYEQELIGLKSPDVLAVTTNMMKVLGSINIDYHGFGFKLNDTDYKHLQEILRLNASSKPLHAQTVLQSMQYRDCDFEALTGEFKRELGHKPGDHVHPVIAAMFLPKIDSLDNHFIHGNISGIVKARYNNEALSTRPDFELFDSITRDPNDIVCDNKSSLLDLLNRCQLQNQLWNCILNLRNGQYYNASFREFVTSIDICKLNKQDNPDLIYGRYDGTILKRLLSSFSFRPTIVSTMPVYNVINMNPYMQNIRPIVTNVPMINLRLPPSISDNTPISLSDALEQHQFFIDNGVVVPKHTSLIYSKGVLFFFVDRRANIIRYNDMQPFNINRLPASVSGFERLNDREIDFELEFPIRGDIYKLRSVVIADVNSNAPERNLVVGSSSMFVIHSDIEQKILQNEYFLYDPMGVIDPVLNNNQKLENRGPISQLYYAPGLGPEGTSFNERARKYGIIFMYELAKDDTKGEVMF